MKTFFGIICAAAFSVALALAEPSPAPATSTTTTATTSTTAATTTTTTESTGVITEFTPGATIVLSTGTGEPLRFKFGNNVTYMNAHGKVINASKIKKDRKVRVHYIKEGNDMIVDKVTVVKD